MFNTRSFLFTRPFIEWFSVLLVWATLLTGCSSSSISLIYPPTGTPTPRPDTLYVLSYFYEPDQPSLSQYGAWRILDPVQIQRFYDAVNALPPYPITTPTVNCKASSEKGHILFLVHGQPTLEVDIMDQCTGLNAYLYGFIPGNPPKIGFDQNILSDRRMANQAIVQTVQQAYRTGVPTPLRDIPYQPPPQK